MRITSANNQEFMWSARPFRSLSEELPVGRTPIAVVLVMEIGSGLAMAKKSAAKYV